MGNLVNAATALFLRPEIIKSESGVQVKLTKKLKAEILKVYNAYWDSFFDGDMRAFASMLDVGVQIIGSSENEVFSNKASAVKFYKATVGQVAGKTALRNRKISMRPVENSVMITEQSDFYALIDDEWTFYGHGRISTLLRKTRKAWKIIYEHGSLPDSKAGEGEQINTERIKAENLQLREAVKRRTIELEQKNRELEIETALERVRAVAMGMQQPADMLQVCRIISEQLQTLKVKDIRNVQTAVFYESKGIYLNYEYYRLYEKTFITEVAYHLQPDVAAFANQMLKDPEAFFTTSFAGSEIKEWIEYQKKANQFVDPKLYEAEALHYYSYSTGLGALSVSSFTPITEEQLNVLGRFRNVFGLAYRRYMDVAQAEAQAHQAVQQASLDRVRAEIASMRTADDLQRITPLIWRELTTLGVPFFRCGVFIIDEATEHAHVYLSTPSGEAVAALHLKFDSAPIIAATVQHWRQQMVYREEWNREQFIAWTQSILKQGLIDSPEKYQGGGEAPEKLVLHFVPFTQGMLYIGSSAALSDDEIELSQSIAKAFGMAYARYEDFQRLEAAKAQVEAALEDLQKTQQQLITQEKLASLGQLTAGIAHEIKNPLNFVNNFAALSVDLAKELREEIEKRRAKSDGRGAESEERGAKGEDEFANIEEILEALTQNAEKINHHGKRADSIVKSMMQHARGSSGQREMTDINHLLDEAVTLVYHGMRANDASFNITIEKDYDETIGKLEVVPQDISRVFLNVINNACYAAHQKARVGEGESGRKGDGVSASPTHPVSLSPHQPFSPTLSVTTKNLGEKIEIRIRDNGNGIPPEFREKIFTPFFTTKPAGQGTGLGLSISYDIIVQEHKGEIQVETEEGKFTDFVVRLPKA